MIAVATGGPRIDSVNQQYIERRDLIRAGLKDRRINDPNPYIDLWAWYGKWSSGDLPTYQSRRTYINGLLSPLIERVQKGPGVIGAEIFGEPTGWAKVDRGLGEIRRALEKARNEEQFQAIGLFCRETLISLAQIVYDSSKHPTQNGVVPSNTDAKRMLEAYISTELAGGPNEYLRRHAKAALALANSLQHSRKANFRKAALCAEATTSVVNLVAIISGQRDP